ncbi:MAG TPA: YiiD C-terminal domain-containing protein [Deltaproteobacteria bacterium]|nr:YiiD C-terminal domain-containing protein [Deltaproteobacteria bacterium]
MIDEHYTDAAAFLEQAVDIIHRTGVKIVELRDRYARIMLPFEPNINHIGTVYGGSLFILAEFSGGVIYYASFDHTRFYPIVKEVCIRFRRPATSDVYLEVELTRERVDEIQNAAEASGKQDWKMDLELKDASGQVCCVVQGTWQLRKF